MIDMQDKVDALTAFHEKGSIVEPFEDAISGGPFGNQHGFTCEDLCRKQAGSAFGQLALGGSSQRQAMPQAAPSLG